MKKELDISTVYLALSLLKEPARKALAGTGHTRRRDQSSAVAIAHHVVSYLRRNWEFHRHGKAVANSEVVAHLASIIWNVPPEITNDHAAIDANNREDARQFIAEEIFATLTAEYEPVYAPERYTGWGGPRLA
ncbi:hypothetical protein [Ensifer sp. LC163]|uniref:hypothetical protein n=1 Tax=Ensifer sp. LC163 TaxID=1120652 RepID=UPI0008138580|nr:hypothetical protein [Ensifer sp. LC163]OCP34927.1 hypothetical protein BC360_29485 [Ensifer sp. LC163]